MEKNCHCVAWQLWDQTENEKVDRSHLWIEIHKPTLRSPPEVPDDLEPWIREEEVSDSTLEEPGLFDEIVRINEPDPDTGEEQEESLFINDHPQIFEAWMHYVENNWKPWAEEDRELQAIQKVYND